MRYNSWRRNQSKITRMKWTSQDLSCLVYVGSDVTYFTYGPQECFYIAKFQFNERNCKPVFVHSKAKNGICKCTSQGYSKPLETSGGKKFRQLIVFAEIKVKGRRGFYVLGPEEDPLDWSLYGLKPENASPSCRDSIVPMLWEIIFIFNFYSCMFWPRGKKLGGLHMLRPCKLLRSDNGVSVDGRDIFVSKS